MMPFVLAHAYLPHRQLRNWAKTDVYKYDPYLPHRQLRKCLSPPHGLGSTYLPHRQLRKGW